MLFAIPGVEIGLEINPIAKKNSLEAAELKYDGFSRVGEGSYTKLPSPKSAICHYPVISKHPS